VIALGHPRGTLPDPLLHDIGLPLSATCYPYGFPVNIFTNSPAVLDAAGEAWNGFTAEFDREPIVVRMVVESEGDLAPEPSHRCQGHLMSIVSDSHNFGVLDLRALFGYAFVSERTAADHTWLRWFFLEPMVLILLTQRHAIPLHSACVAKNGCAMLLCGNSGAGKSTLAFACARAGWTFVSDDASWLVPGSADLTVLGKPHQARLRHDAQRLFPELEGYIARARPNGKISIEVPTAEFPEIRTAMRERPRVLVFLRRQEAGAAHLQHLSPRQVWDELTGDGAYATYGDEVGLRHLAERKRLLELPGYCLYYSDLDGAIGQLSHLADGMEKR
jgi:hypothetical protein